MKKTLLALGTLALFTLPASADCLWSWWPGHPSANTTKEVKGCALGIGSKVKAIASGAEVSLVYSATSEVQRGAQVAVFGLSKAKTVTKGAQVGFVTIADKAMVQAGLVCINKNGFLPVFIFFNLDKSLFN